MSEYAVSFMNPTENNVCMDIQTGGLSISVEMPENGLVISHRYENHTRLYFCGSRIPVFNPFLPQFYARAETFVDIHPCSERINDHRISCIRQGRLLPGLNLGMVIATLGAPYHRLSEHYAALAEALRSSPTTVVLDDVRDDEFPPRTPIVLDFFDPELTFPQREIFTARPLVTPSEALLTTLVALFDAERVIVTKNEIQIVLENNVSIIPTSRGVCFHTPSIKIKPPSWFSMEPKTYASIDCG